MPGCSNVSNPFEAGLDCFLLIFVPSSILAGMAIALGAYFLLRVAMTQYNKARSE